MGTGDRTIFFEKILASDPRKYVDLGKKIRLITAKKIGPYSVYNDKNCVPEKLHKGMAFRLWLHCYRKYKCV